MAAALEKDAELDRRIAALRRKNEALVRRYQEIEEDRRRAEHEGGNVTPWGGEGPGGGGGGLGGPSPAGPGGGGGAGPDRKSQEWEQRRLQNIEQMNEEMEKIAEYERSRREGQPERNPVRNFLDDQRAMPRAGALGAGHQRNWGGPDLGKATARRGGSRFGEGSPPLDPTLWMTGRQRAEHERWKRERERIDRERLQRHRDHNGAWRREWDAQKPEALFSGVPEEPEGGGASPGPAPPPPTLAEFCPSPRAAGGGGAEPGGRGGPTVSTTIAGSRSRSLRGPRSPRRFRKAAPPRGGSRGGPRRTRTSGRI
ncbi:coiled-coil domain-containing protein 9 [Camarhynchus parvulus]|uniref:coiled-coil domain-containing protein 9 n=1 Tax=Geospiza parvula TaxID=87175 RepID=UPI001237F219|nr:coiled-coil domain-containing protein 9 [Camarhynchus parvulus]